MAGPCSRSRSWAATRSPARFSGSSRATRHRERPGAVGASRRRNPTHLSYPLTQCASRSPPAAATPRASTRSSAPPSSPRSTAAGTCSASSAATPACSARTKSSRSRKRLRARHRAPRRHDPAHDESRQPVQLPVAAAPTAASTDVDRSDELIENARQLGIDAIISIGGDGSLAIAQQLCDEGHADRRRAEDDRQRRERARSPRSASTPR